VTLHHIDIARTVTWLHEARAHLDAHELPPVGLVVDDLQLEARVVGATGGRLGRHEPVLLAELFITTSIVIGGKRTSASPPNCESSEMCAPRWLRRPTGRSPAALSQLRLLRIQTAQACGRRGRPAVPHAQVHTSWSRSFLTDSPRASALRAHARHPGSPSQSTCG